MGFSQGAGMAALLAAMVGFPAPRRRASTDVVVRRWRSLVFIPISRLNLLFLSSSVSSTPDRSS